MDRNKLPKNENVHLLEKRVTGNKSGEDFVYGSVVLDSHHFDTPRQKVRVDISLSTLLTGLDSKLTVEERAEQCGNNSDESIDDKHVDDMSYNEPSLPLEITLIDIPIDALNMKTKDLSDTNNPLTSDEDESEDKKETTAMERDFSFVIWMMLVLEGEYPSEILERLIESESMKNLSKSLLLQEGLELISKMQDI